MRDAVDGLLASASATRHAATPLAWLLVVAVLLELTKQAALLHFHVEALQRVVNRFVGLNRYVNQTLSGLRRVDYGRLFAWVQLRPQTGRR